MKGGYDQFFKAAKQAKSPDPTIDRSAKPSAKSAPGRELSEDDLKKMFKVARKTRKRRSKAPPVPWSGMILSFLAVVFSAWFFFQPEKLENLWNSLDVSFGGAATAAESAKKSPDPASDPAKTAPDKVMGDPQEKESSEKQDLSYFSKLSKRKAELDEREKALNELEEELHRQRGEIELQIKRLAEMRRQIASVLKERVEIDEEKVNRLVEVYSNMKPKQAAEILSTLNEDLAVEVLGRMKKKNAADILNLVDPAKAQVLSEKYAGYKKR